MKTTAFMATAILSMSATALAQSTCDTVLNTGSMDVTAGGVSCAADGFTTPNNFAKSYDLATLLPGQDFELSCIEFGVGNSGTDIPARITVYTDTDGALDGTAGVCCVAGAATAKGSNQRLPNRPGCQPFSAFGGAREYSKTTSLASTENSTMYRLLTQERLRIARELLDPRGKLPHRTVL